MFDLAVANSKHCEHPDSQLTNYILVNYILVCLLLAGRAERTVEVFEPSEEERIFEDCSTELYSFQTPLSRESGPSKSAIFTNLNCHKNRRI
jgi:hypothetical protein